MSYRFLVVALCGVAVLLAGAAGLRGRLERCAYVPLLAGELLPNATLAPAPELPRMPAGWQARPGVELRGPQIGDGGGFDLDGDGRALQLIGIANYAQTPPVPVQPGRSYCFSGRALTDAGRSSTRLRAVFRWLDAQGQPLPQEDAGDWQPVALWSPALTEWSPVGAAFAAPGGAASLLVRLEPTSDDRIYLDALHVRHTLDVPRVVALADGGVQVLPWPGGAAAALSFSFDWETAMGGLIHSRSVDDPHADQDPLLRAMRMREGVTTTLALFAPHDIRATYYANGYNFLPGNPTRRRFMDDPVFDWASRANHWQTDQWQTTPWFQPDPYGTVASDPGWYFGDLLPQLRAAGQDIQSHSFSHLHAGLASPAQLRDDLAAWRTLAAEVGLPPARSLAFPWSSSAGMSDRSWRVLEEGGITSVTRTNWTQRQYDLFDRDDQGYVARPYCRPLPGHAAILACPDLYLTVEHAALALRQIDTAIAAGGMIDLWAHTEEVTSAAQIAAWREVVEYAAQQQAAGRLWIAPLAEIAERQQATALVQVLVDAAPSSGQPLVFTLHNGSQQRLVALTLALPFPSGRALADGQPVALDPTNPAQLALDLGPGQTVEVSAWPG